MSASGYKQVAQLSQRDRATGWASYDQKHRRSQGVQWVHLHPQGGDFFFGRSLQGKCVSDTKCTPQPEQESVFRTVFPGRVRFGGIFRRSLMATTKKRSSTFWQEKCTLPDKILATPMTKSGRL